MLTREQKDIINNIDYITLHNHSDFSNIRLLDSINKPKELIDRAIELGFNGIAITDHEHLGALPEGLWYVEELQKENESLRNFKFILGNSIASLV